MKKEELTNLFMKFVEDKFPELIEGEKSPFNHGDRYYCIFSNGEVESYIWNDFPVEKLKVLHELSELARPFSYESGNWCFYLNSEGIIDYYTAYENQHLYGDYYFDSREEAIRAVEKIGKNRIHEYLFS